MNKKTIAIIVALLLVVLAIFGITKFTGKEGNTEGESVVITHELGETTVNKNPKRIFIVAPAGITAIHLYIGFLLNALSSSEEEASPSISTNPPIGNNLIL